MSPIPSQGEDIARTGAIVCIHVADDGLPIRVARRDPPVHDADSGWQFHCDVHDHGGDDDAVMVAVEEVVDLDPSIRPLLGNPPKTAFRRESPNRPWTPEPYDAD